MTYYFSLLRNIIILLCLCFFYSCDIGKDEPDSTSISKRTILLYVIATNDISNSLHSDIKEVEQAILNNDINNCRVLIYLTTFSTEPELYEIIRSNNKISKKSLKKYDSNIRSTTKQRMSEVIKDVVNLSDSEEYGLVLCSHAWGWSNSLTTKSKSTISPMSFGIDYGSIMPIDSLAEAIPSGVFDFIYTDACYMGGIEIAYELRHKTKYYIGSVAEVHADGMDYTNNIPCFLANVVNLKEVCENTFNKYNNQTGTSQTCTISLVDCSKLDYLAQLCKEIHNNGTIITDFSSIQTYKRTEPFLFYDFAQYTKLLATEQQKTAFDILMAETVLYKAATPKIFNKLIINPAYYSGLSTYIIGTTSPTGENETYYKTLAWYKDVISKQ